MGRHLPVVLAHGNADVRAKRCLDLLRSAEHGNMTVRWPWYMHFTALQLVAATVDL